MPSKHIVTSFDSDLDKLRSLITEMGGLVEAQLADALDVVAKYNPDKAKKIIARDKKLDDLEVKVDAFAVQTLALRAPVAEDLRIIITALKISSNLERMGDYCKNIAKRMINLPEGAKFPDPFKSLVVLGKMTMPMIQGVLDAFVEEDAKKALKIIEQDEDVDRVYSSVFREYLTYMMEDSKNISVFAHMLFMAKNIERIGDHATNIAEQVYFMLEGKFPEDERPKGDVSPGIILKGKK